ncbi:SdiA-regulated domain-containing protein [Neolewinella persica]|uniref:SdiA-regulated domain-containing protein n=1 Tax=Neolewinella persica TaxID=70998 RepID=UPI00035FDEEF|nr:SdiA-regulated domain-containing protein [Neolewinella persica]
MIKPICLLLFSLFTFNLFPQSAAKDYDYDAPELIGNLPPELDEISGLSMSPYHRNELLAVQDEEGKIFRINAKTGALLFAVTFWKDGDYEAIEAVGSDVWVVKNTGTLYQVSNVGKLDQQVEKFNTSLTGDNDVEGLAYDAKKNRLLLACKKDAKDDGNDKDGRYIYAFDLATKTLSKDPVFAIELEAVKNYLNVCEKTTGHEQLCDFFLTKDEYDLAPSAIAIHPITGQLFITSSVGKVLMVLNPDGRIDHLQRLDKKFYAQPEGLAFDSDGTLYISTEKKKSESARVYRLAYRPA